jgi:RimK family alpha-L-glutamate ligase
VACDPRHLIGTPPHAGCGFSRREIGTQPDSALPDRSDDPGMAVCSAPVSAPPLVGVVGWPQETNVELVKAWQAGGIRAELVEPPTALQRLGHGDTALGRLDVLRKLDGVEPGVEVMGDLARIGVRVLNDAHALLRSHDKLLTAACLELAGIPHPRTVSLRDGEAPSIDFPFVLKPRFGSWGADVFLCRTSSELSSVLGEVSARPWFQKHGALLQELLPPVGYDVRLIVAAGRVVGAIRRVAAPGEWRTNVSLGGTRERVALSADACRLGIAAAAAIEGDLVGVDLFPVGAGHIVLELNGAVEFDELYSLPGADVYEDVARALRLLRTRVAA